MRKLIPNKALIEALSGAIGDLVFYRDADGNLIVQSKGKRIAPLSRPVIFSAARLKSMTRPFPSTVRSPLERERRI